MSHFGYWLHRATQCISLQKRRELLKCFKTAEAIYHFSLNELAPFGITGDMYTKHFTGAMLRAAEDHVLTHKNAGVQVLTCDKSSFPQGYKGVIYVKGDRNLDLNAISICYISGTRSLSKVGELMMPKVISYHLSGGGVIATGIAGGCEREVIKGSIDGGVLVFLPQSIDTCSNKEGVLLKAVIQNQGFVISPFPLGTHCYPNNFHIRNKLLGQLCANLTIIEAPLRSGSLLSARALLSESKPVYVVKPRAGAAGCAGNARLLTEGASIIACDYWEDSLPNSPVLRAIRDGTFSYEAIDAIDAELMDLELSGFIVHRRDDTWAFRGW